MAQTVSPRWERHVRRGANPVTYVDVRFPGQGTVYEGLPVESCSLTVDRGNTVRTSGSLVVPSQELNPVLRRESPLNVSGAEIVIRSGLRYPDGTEELVPLGVFQLHHIGGSEAGGNIPTLRFYDRMKLLERDNRAHPVDFGGQLIQTVIEDVALHAAPFYPGDSVEWQVHIDSEVDNFPLPFGTVMDGKPSDFLAHLAESLGADVYFGRDGDLHVVPVPGIRPIAEINSIVADWVLDTGLNGVLKDATREISQEGVYNGVAMFGTGDSDSARPFAQVVDNNPDSQTYWEGPFGKKLYKAEDSNLTSDTQCQVAARSKLAELSTFDLPLPFDIVGHAAIDVGDIATVRFLAGDERTGMVDSFTYDPLSMSLGGILRDIFFEVEE